MLLEQAVVDQCISAPRRRSSADRTAGLRSVRPKVARDIGQVLQDYIIPLFSIFLGAVLLKEQLGKTQLTAIVNAGSTFPRSAGAKFPTLRVWRSALQVMGASISGRPTTALWRRRRSDCGM